MTKKNNSALDLPDYKFICTFSRKYSGTEVDNLNSAKVQIVSILGPVGNTVFVTITQHVGNY